VCAALLERLWLPLLAAPAALAPASILDVLV
jgi:hypothetical protein